jgi:putative membrane protein
MSFRNGACYDRWWEGRKQWGQLIFEVRSFARETATLKDGQARADMLRGLCGFAHTLAARLRDKDEGAAANPWLREKGDLLQSPNIANAVLAQIGATCSALAERGAISEWRYAILESRLTGLSGVQAACERIKNTPVPFAYTLLIHRTVYLFCCCLLPFGLVGQLGWMTPFLVTVLSYAFLGLDALAAELEEPFGYTENVLPLDALVRIVEREVLAALGVQTLPAALEPDNFRLL